MQLFWNFLFLTSLLCTTLSSASPVAPVMQREISRRNNFEFQAHDAVPGSLLTSRSIALDNTHFNDLSRREPEPEPFFFLAPLLASVGARVGAMAGRVGSMASIAGRGIKNVFKGKGRSRSNSVSSQGRQAGKAADRADKGNQQLNNNKDRKGGRRGK